MNPIHTLPPPLLTPEDSSHEPWWTCINPHLLALSHDGNTIAIAKGTAVFISSVGEDGHTEAISEQLISCIVFASFSSNVTTLIAGSQSGHVYFWSRRGELLLTLWPHPEPVLSLSLRINTQTHGPMADQGEELLILHKTGIVVALDGLALFGTVRSAHAKQSLPSLPFARKLRLKGQDSVSDVAGSGIPVASAGSALVNSSDISLASDYVSRGGSAVLAGGSGGASAGSGRYIAVGSGPPLAIYDIGRRISQISAVAIAADVAGRLGGALLGAARGWWSSPAPSAPAEPQFESCESLPFTACLDDQRRVGHSIVTDPTSRLAAVADSFGRVLLIDVAEFVIVRMWKGYRDARLAFIQVGRPWPSAIVLYLAIYAPRRGLLEVWRLRHGPRVLAQNVGPGCHLIPTGSQFGVRFHSGPQRACLLSSDGSLSEISIAAGAGEGVSTAAPGRGDSLGRSEEPEPVVDLVFDVVHEEPTEQEATEDEKLLARLKEMLSDEKSDAWSRELDGSAELSDEFDDDYGCPLSVAELDAPHQKLLAVISRISVPTIALEASHLLEQSENPLLFHRCVAATLLHAVDFALSETSDDQAVERAGSVREYVLVQSRLLRAYAIISNWNPTSATTSRVVQTLINSHMKAVDADEIAQYEAEHDSDDFHPTFSIKEWLGMFESGRLAHCGNIGIKATASEKQSGGGRRAAAQRRFTSIASWLVSPMLMDGADVVKRAFSLLSLSDDEVFDLLIHCALSVPVSRLSDGCDERLATAAATAMHSLSPGVTDALLANALAQASASVHLGRAAVVVKALGRFGAWGVPSITWADKAAVYRSIQGLGFALSHVLFLRHALVDVQVVEWAKASVSSIENDDALSVGRLFALLALDKIDLPLLQSRFPRSSSSWSVALHQLVLWGVRWNTDHKIQSLEAAITLLRHTKKPSHSAVFVWEAYLTNSVKGVFGMIQQNGKPPTDGACVRACGLSSLVAGSLLEWAVEALDIASGRYPDPVLPPLDEAWPKIDPTHAAIDRLSSVGLPDATACAFHASLLTATLLILRGSSSRTRPLSLFPPACAPFEPLVIDTFTTPPEHDSPPPTPIKVDNDELNALRLRFIIDGMDVDQAASRSLATRFGIDADVVTREWIQRLLWLDRDDEALPLIRDVEDIASVGSVVTVIGRARMACALRTPQGKRHMGTLPNTVCEWILAAPRAPSWAKCGVSVARTERALAAARSLLVRGTPAARWAEQLGDAATQLMRDGMK